MFCWKPGITATQTYEMHENIYKNEGISCMHVFEWFQWFRDILKMVQRVGICQPLEIQKQLLKFVKLCPGQPKPKDEPKTDRGSTAH